MGDVPERGPTSVSVYVNKALHWKIWLLILTCDAVMDSCTSSSRLFSFLSISSKWEWMDDNCNKLIYIILNSLCTFHTCSMLFQQYQSFFIPDHYSQKYANFTWDPVRESQRGNNTSYLEAVGPEFRNTLLLKPCSHVTFAFPSTFKFNIVSMVMKTRTQRMGVRPFSAFPFASPLT